MATDELTADEVAISNLFAATHGEKFHSAVCDSHELLRADRDRLREEHMEHDKVRDLIMDLSAELARERAHVVRLKVQYDTANRVALHEARIREETEALLEVRGRELVIVNALYLGLTKQLNEARAEIARLLT
jgi:hypothetical protein